MDWFFFYSLPWLFSDEFGSFFFLVSQAVVSCLVFLFCGGGCFFSLSFSLPILIPSPRGKKWSGLKWETRARSNELLLQSEEPVGWRPPDQMEVPSLSEWTSERAGVFVLPASGATQDQTAQTRTRAHPWNSLPARAGRQQTGKRIVKKKKVPGSVITGWIRSLNFIKDDVWVNCVAPLRNMFAQVWSGRQGAKWNAHVIQSPALAGWIRAKLLFIEQHLVPFNQL